MVNNSELSVLKLAPPQDKSLPLLANWSVPLINPKTPVSSSKSFEKSSGAGVVVALTEGERAGEIDEVVDGEGKVLIDALTEGLATGETDAEVVDEA
jgi:hypothetical protein